MRLSRRTGLRLMVALFGLAACSDGAETDASTTTLGVPPCDTTDTVDDPSVLNGVYQVDWSYEDLAEASGLPREIVEENDGLITVTLVDGCFSTAWEEGTPCAGSYIVTGDRISWVATKQIANWGCAPELLGLEISNTAWELTEDQLTLSDFEQIEGLDDIWNVLNTALFGAKPLTRVEGVE
jgi:hypothetical protein